MFVYALFADLLSRVAFGLILWHGTQFDIEVFHMCFDSLTVSGKMCVEYFRSGAQMRRVETYVCIQMHDGSI